jgi:hypothetical protein
MWDAIALWVIVAQGFFVMFFEYDVWRMNKHRFDERAEWRQAKRKQITKKVEASTTTPASIVGERGL